MVLTAAPTAPDSGQGDVARRSRSAPTHLDTVRDDDEGAARIFHALCDPSSFRLLLHALEVGQHGIEVERLLDMPAGSAAVHLDRLIDAGLMLRTQRDDGTDVYRVTNTATIERLLTTVRKLGTRDREA